jgi:hypothetical protein
MKLDKYFLLLFKLELNFTCNSSELLSKESFRTLISFSVFVEEVE